MNERAPKLPVEVVDKRNLDPKVLAEYKAALGATREREAEEAARKEALEVARVESLNEDQLAAELRAGEIVLERQRAQERKRQQAQDSAALEKAKTDAMGAFEGSESVDDPEDDETTREQEGNFKIGAGGLTQEHLDSPAPTATNEASNLSTEAIAAKRIITAERQVQKLFDAGDDPEVLQMRFEDELERAQSNLEELDPNQTTEMARIKGDIEAANAKIYELERLVNGLDLKGKNELAA